MSKRKSIRLVLWLLLITSFVLAAGQGGAQAAVKAKPTKASPLARQAKKMARRITSAQRQNAAARLARTQAISPAIGLLGASGPAGDARLLRHHPQLRQQPPANWPHRQFHRREWRRRLHGADRQHNGYQLGQRTGATATATVTAGVITPSP